MLIDERRAWLEANRVRFLYVGDGHLGPKVREILGEGLGAPFVTLAGLRPQRETPEILAASDVLLSPHVPNADGSPFFGSPTKLFEYMAMARLIVASDLDQIGQVLRGWRPGEARRQTAEPCHAANLVTPGDVSSLVEGIVRAVEMSPAERRAKGDAARRIVLEAYTWDRNVAGVLERFSDAARAVEPSVGAAPGR